MERIEDVKRLVCAALDPDRIEIIDESELHRGHAGWSKEGASHLALFVTARAFHGKSRIERHRMVHAALAVPLAQGLHALRLRLLSPEEDQV